MFVIHHQELLSHNVEQRHDTIIEAFGCQHRCGSTHWRKNNHANENDTTSSSKI